MFVTGIDLAIEAGGRPLVPLPLLLGSTYDEADWLVVGIRPPVRGKDPWRNAAAPMLAQSSSSVTSAISRSAMGLSSDGAE